MKKALVTGANGFLGSLLVEKLIENNVEVIAADLCGQNDRISPKARFVDFDMHRCSELLSKIADRDIDVIFHMAWGGSSGILRGDYALQLDNVKCMCDAVKTAAEMRIKRFIGAGTLAQMDCMAYIEQNGSSPNAVSCYGSAKIAAQYMSKAIANFVGIEHIWCYISNIYGVGDTTNNFINFACKKMLKGERASFTAGEHIYDFVYITDTIRGLYLCAENGRNNNSYYIGSSKQRKLKEFIEIIRDNIDPNIPLFLGEVPFNGVSLSDENFSCKHIQNDTGYSSEIDFKDGIKKTIRWLREVESDTKI